MRGATSTRSDFLWVVSLPTPSWSSTRPPWGFMQGHPLRGNRRSPTCIAVITGPTCPPANSYINTTARPEPPPATETTQPVTQTATANPVTQTVTAQPESQTATAKPETQTATAKPETQTATAKPESQTATAKPETQTARIQPESQASGLRLPRRGQPCIKPHGMQTERSAWHGGTSHTKASDLVEAAPLSRRAQLLSNA